MNGPHSTGGGLPSAAAFTVLCRLLDPRRTPDDLRTELAAVTDWSGLLERARLLGIRSLLAHALGRAGAMDAVPDEARAALLGAAFRQAERAEKALLALRPVLDALHAAGLPVLVIKGPVSSLRAYGAAEVRPFTDIDLLTAPRDRRHAFEVIRGLGFTSSCATALPVETYFDRATDFILQDPATGLRIDLCRGFEEHYYRLNLPFDALWERSVIEQVGEVGVRALAPVDDVLYLCYHGAKHAWSNLAWVLDLAGMAARNRPAFDPEALPVAAAAAGGTVAVAFGMMLADHVAPGLLPGGLLDWAQGNRRAARLAADVVATFAQGIRPSGDRAVLRFAWGCTEGFAARVRFAGRMLFVPTLNDYRGCPLPRPLFFAYALLRPVRLVLVRVMHAAAAAVKKN